MAKSDNAMYGDRRYKGVGTTLPYSTTGNLTDRGYPDSKSGVGGIGATPESLKPKYVSTPTGGDTGNGSGKSSKSSATTDSYSGVGDYLASLYAQRQQAAQDAYDRSKALLDDAYNTASGNYANIYNSGANQLKKTYNNSLGKINANATDAFRQAYVNRMQSEKNLAQRLAAMGISGGASESTMAGLLNNYGNARNGIQRTLDSNRNDLEMNYSSNLNDLYNAYQSQMAALDQNRASQLAQLINNLNNQIASVQGDYFSMMAKNPDYLRQALGAATANMNAYEAPALAEATNGLTPVDIYQSNDQGGTLTNYARQAWEDYMERARANNTDEDIIMSVLRGTYGLDPTQIHNALQMY